MTNIFHGTARRSEGSSILETALLMPVLFLLICGAIDFGRAYYTAIEVASAAHAGALYGAQNPTDISGMETAANHDASDMSAIQSSAVHGCECADGSSSVSSCTSTPSCPDNYVNYVAVTATYTYAPLIKYPGIPSQITLSSTSRLRVGGD